MAATATADQDTCEAGCRRGYLPCPHDTFELVEGMRFCLRCDTPDDEPNPEMSCDACF